MGKAIARRNALQTNAECPKHGKAPQSSKHLIQNANGEDEQVKQRLAALAANFMQG